MKKHKPQKPDKHIHHKHNHQHAKTYTPAVCSCNFKDPFKLGKCTQVASHKPTSCCEHVKPCCSKKYCKVVCTCELVELSYQKNECNHSSYRQHSGCHRNHHHYNEHDGYDYEHDVQDQYHEHHQHLEHCEYNHHYDHHQHCKHCEHDHHYEHPQHCKHCGHDHHYEHHQHQDYDYYENDTLEQESHEEYYWHRMKY